jgi:cell division inhibitor SulA
MTPALAALLSHPALWRGGDCAPEPAALPTGHPGLDAVLPGGGWPSQALAEVLLAREGIGELRLVLPALARLTRAGRQVVWIAPPYRPYAPALAAAGVDLARLVLVRCRDAAESLWAFDQALRAPECGAAFAWLSERDERKLHRLAVAAREGRTFGVLWRRPGVTAQAVSAPLRLGLASGDGMLEVRVLKRRGGEVAAPVRIDVARRWSTLPDGMAPSAAFGPRAPNRPVRPAGPPADPRTSAGYLQAETRNARRRHAAN